MIVTTSSLTIPVTSALRREMPRPVEFRQPGYEAAFDGRTIFYDVYRHDDHIVLCGPPLLNLQAQIGAGRFTSGGRKLTAELVDIDRTQRSTLHGPVGDTIALDMPRLSAVLPVSPDGRDLLRGRRVLYTASRNNRLEWIADWLRFYVRIHEIDAVLFYDNGSDAYSLKDLDRTISGVPGIEAAVVISWPFLFGPGGDVRQMWDSDFFQAGRHEHARFRFLGKAAQVINADIDELVVTDDGRPLHRHLAEADKGGLLYRGHWIEGAPTETLPRFVDFDGYNAERKPCPTKWTIDPSRVPPTAQWSIHGFARWWPNHAEAVHYGHFRHITTNWKYERSVIQADGLTKDQVLRDAMTRAFPSSGTAPPGPALPGPNPDRTVASP